MVKNRRIITTAALTLGLMLTGCSETTVTEESQNKVKEEAESKSESTTLIAYSTEMEGYMNDFTITMTEFSDLNMEASVDPSIMASSDWMVDMSSVLIDMDKHIAGIRTVTPPEEMEVSHDYVLKAMDSFEFVVDNYPDSLEDPELMSDCIDALGEGGANLDKAIEETNDFAY